MSQTKQKPCSPPELWGGIECTIVRIKDDYSDQLSSTGHYSRPSDLDRLAELGIKTLRYPLLWELQQPDRQKKIDWTWADQQMDALRGHGIKPIAGLLHHGSGPAFTDLGSADFPALFADYAARVAERYPWLDCYTPINEPLTTARFSGLYGIWYPHKKEPYAFLNILLNQLKGIVLAMKAIRAVNPAAQLIQTEDLAKTHSTPLLSYQADFENERRWLTFDLLCGKVDKDHPLWDYLLYTGVEESRLAFFLEDHCVPDICGVNYYVTSERFLDQRTSDHPASCHGGNGIHTYADTEAVRNGRASGLAVLLEEVWNRYYLPTAITEVHLNCTREDQIRWLMEVWNTACLAKQDGIDIRAVTAWSLLGANDWDSLLTQNSLHYESGAFEIKDNIVKMTAVGQVIKALASAGKYDHPLLAGGGWWTRDSGRLPSDKTLLLIGSGEDLRNNALLTKCAKRRIACQAIYSRNIKIFRNVVENGLQRYNAWGMLSVMAPAEEKEILNAISGEKGVPYLDLPIHFFFSGQQIDRELDLFIDKAVGAINTNILRSYVKEQVHVCHGD